MPNHPNRKRNRLPGYDYSQPGYYYVTICTQERGEIFGRINNGKMEQNQYGNIALRYFQEIPLHYHGVLLDEYIIMPDHVHAIIVINQPMPGNESGNHVVNQMGKNAGNNVGTEHCSVPTISINPTIIPTNTTAPFCCDPNISKSTNMSISNIINPIIHMTDEIRRHRYGLLSKIVKSYKEIVVKTIRKQYNDYGFIWQRSFYDHIIRNERSLNIIRGYILRNPATLKLKSWRKKSYS